MHQINLEKMSPVIHNIDGIASPDTLVGTDSHTLILMLLELLLLELVDLKLKM